MRKNLNILLLIAVVTGLSSCGSVISLFEKGQGRPVRLMQAPGDLEVYVAGEKKVVTSEVFASYDNITRYTAGVKLPYKKDLTIELRSQGKSVMVDMKAKGARPYFWLNLFFCPIVGHIIDKSTKNNKMLFPNYVDVEYALQGKPQKEWRGKGKLKRMEKRQIR